MLYADGAAAAVGTASGLVCAQAYANVFFGKVQGDFYRFAADAETIWAGGNESPAFNDHDKASNTAYSNAFDLVSQPLGASATTEQCAPHEAVMVSACLLGVCGTGSQ